MPPLTADVEQAARRVAEASVSPETWNPVYRTLVAAPDRAPAGAGRGEHDPASTALLGRHFASPALLVVAATEADSTSRLRIGLHPDAATVETSRDGSPSTWSAAPVERLPALIEQLLTPIGLAGGPARLEVRRESTGLRLTREEIEQVRLALSRGAAPTEAFAAADGIDPDLLDALTAKGPRAAVSLTRHDPSGRHLRSAQTWSRLWVRGERSLYRVDDTLAALGPVHPVADGDVLGSVLPVLQDGLRFAAARPVRTEAR
ncbi:hypothetical protein BH708_18700 [Brachybacterium sp. P6-10-X1]|uniref:hypothetical protein n=1 Tax=Brachybacterium sp. P6-10-X1 TaxID=1903186 RepID=UPI0009717DEA|nr:hypothetical protein [Brachybacterium sp. P6-10-X1]APX34400.1 hypothetical protein BH708_18700 [Brachybacterium sp. P6-10-X1]